jgi:hypothetical protein
MDMVPVFGRFENSCTTKLVHLSANRVPRMQTHTYKQTSCWTYIVPGDKRSPYHVAVDSGRQRGPLPKPSSSISITFQIHPVVCVSQIRISTWASLSSIFYCDALIFIHELSYSIHYCDHVTLKHCTWA